MDYNAGWMDIVGARLRDFGPDRLAGMDASGISVAILSHTVPGVQGIVDPAAAVTAAREINDRLAAEVAHAADPLCRVRQHRAAGSEDARRSSSNARSPGSG